MAWSDLKLNADQVNLNCKEVLFFGQCVTASGIKPNPVKVDTIRSWPFLTKLTELVSFIGSVNYLSRFNTRAQCFTKTIAITCKGEYWIYLASAPHWCIWENKRCCFSRLSFTVLWCVKTTVHRVWCFKERTLVYSSITCFWNGWKGHC